MLNYCEYNLTAFTNALASGAPTPGGGGAAALTGSLAAALGGMVCSLTEGKARYAAHRADFDRLSGELSALRRELLALVEADARAFEPLSRAYAISGDDPTRAETMENALRTAAEPPMAMLRACARGAQLTAELVAFDPLPAATDAGCAAALFGAGLDCAALNLRVNTKSMADRACAEAMNAECEQLLAQYKPMAAHSLAKIMEVL